MTQARHWASVEEIESLLTVLEEQMAGDPYLDNRVHLTLGPPLEDLAVLKKDSMQDYWFWVGVSTYTRNIYSALELAKRVLPSGYSWMVMQTGGQEKACVAQCIFLLGTREIGRARAATPALAVVCALLKALHHSVDDQQVI